MSCITLLSRSFPLDPVAVQPGMVRRRGGSNPSEATAGQYFDSNFVSHGFVRTADGTIVSFDAPGAGTGGTNAFSISPSGAAMGWYLDTNFTFHGFVRTP